MGKGGARPNAGRPQKPLQDHLRAGTWRPDRHGPRPVGNVVPLPVAASDWRPSAEERKGLGPRAIEWLEATLASYALEELEGRRLLAALRTLTRVALERAIGTGVTDAAGLPHPSLPALAREQRTLLSQWSALESGTGAVMAIRRASLPAAPLTPEVAAIVLAGWGAKPPADAGPSDKSAFWQLAGGWGIGDAQPDDLFTVWSQHDAGHRPCVASLSFVARGDRGSVGLDA